MLLYGNFRIGLLKMLAGGSLLQYGQKNINLCRPFWNAMKPKRLKNFA
jgi:hypothetical protein